MKPGDTVAPASLAVLEQVTEPSKLPMDAPESERRLSVEEIRDNHSFRSQEVKSRTDGRPKFLIVQIYAKQRQHLRSTRYPWSRNLSPRGLSSECSGQCC